MTASLRPFLPFVVLATACGMPGPGAPEAVRDPCLVARAGAGAPAVVRVALAGPVDPTHAPDPRTDAEAFLFGHLYAGLAAAGCEAAPRPALATAWEPADDATRWSVSLTAPWSALQAASAPWPPGEVRWPATMGSVGLAAPDVLTLEFSDPVPGLPMLLTDPGLALVGARPDAGGLPAATGPWRLTAADGGGWRLEPAVPDRPVLEVRLDDDPAGAVLDGRADLAVVRDGARLARVAGDPRLGAIPLAWDRTWMLASPADNPLARLADPDDLLASLGGDHRAAPPGAALWLAQATCPRPPGAPRRADEIGHLPADTTGARLAARLVALAQRRGLLVRAVAWEPGARTLPAALVLPASRLVRATCATTVAAPEGWTLTPLVEGRATAVLRAGAASLLQDGRGGVRVVGAFPESSP